MTPIWKTPPMTATIFTGLAACLMLIALVVSVVVVSGTGFICNLGKVFPRNAVARFGAAFKAFESPDASQRERAVQLLAYTAGHCPRLTERVVPVLVRALDDEALRVRGLAITSIGRLGFEARSALPALESARGRHTPWEDHLITEAQFFVKTARPSFNEISQCESFSASALDGEFALATAEIPDGIY